MGASANFPARFHGVFVPLNEASFTGIMKCTHRWLILCLVPFLSPLVNAASPDEYNIVWTSPSANHHGSMPLGNGDIALNAWMTKDGDLHFYISKTDAWDENARLCKVGRMRVKFDPPLKPGGRRLTPA